MWLQKTLDTFSNTPEQLVPSTSTVWYSKHDYWMNELDESKKYMVSGHFEMLSYLLVYSIVLSEGLVSGSTLWRHIRHRYLEIVYYILWSLLGKCTLHIRTCMERLRSSVPWGASYILSILNGGCSILKSHFLGLQRAVVIKPHAHECRSTQQRETDGETERACEKMCVGKHHFNIICQYTYTVRDPTIICTYTATKQ